MEIVAIFASDDIVEKGGLFAVRYEEEDLDEYERLFDIWNDEEWIFNYLLQNRNYLSSTYFKGVSSDTIQQTIVQEATFLENYFIGLAERNFSRHAHTLQQLFKPLDNREYALQELQKQKAQVTSIKFRQRFLRLYAIRIHENLFIITGGAIKLTLQMKDHPDTHLELLKIDQVRNFLKDNGISTADDLIYYYDNFS